jgi:hypothetical protein
VFGMGCKQETPSGELSRSARTPALSLIIPSFSPATKISLRRKLKRLMEEG